MKESIEVNADMLSKALSQLNHQNCILIRDYMQGKDDWRESLEVSRPNFGSTVKLCISREKDCQAC